MSESLLVHAILENDSAAASSLLRAAPALATQCFEKQTLYLSPLFHWIYSGDTFLHMAAAGYRVEIIRALLQAGADPNSSHNRRKSSPLHYACDGVHHSPGWNPAQQTKTIQLLLKAGARVNAQDNNGATPLHRATRTRCSAAVRCLFQNGADATLKNKPGSTPFHLAVQNTGRGGSGTDMAKTEQLKIISEFLSAGLSPLLKDAKGKTVLDSARSDEIRRALAS